MPPQIQLISRKSETNVILPGCKERVNLGETSSINCAYNQE